MRKLFSIATLILICLFRSEPLFSQELVAKARDEKKLVLYHSTGIEDTQQILERFRKRYPFLQVENHRLSSVKIIQRIITEVRAGRDLADERQDDAQARVDLEQLMPQLVPAVRLAGRPAWLHLDLDVLDEGVLPAVSYPQPLGLDWDEFVTVCRPLVAAPNLLGISVADFNPDHDADGTHAARVVEALVQVCGR